MWKPAHATVLALLFLSLLEPPDAAAEAPVLSWSARAGTSIISLAGTAILPGGEVAFAGRSMSGGTEDHLAAGVLDASGTSLVWSRKIGGLASEYAIAIAAGPDGSVYLAALTQSIDFPMTSGDLPRNARNGTYEVLLRFDPSGQTLYSILLPEGFSTTALLPASDGTLYLAGFAPAEENKGRLLRISADGKEVLANVGFEGSASTLAIDRAGRILAVGEFKRRPIAIRFAAGLAALEFRTQLPGEAAGTVTAVTADGEGSIYLGSCLAPTDEPSRADTGWGRGFFVPNRGWPALAHLDASGGVIFHRRLPGGAPVNTLACPSGIAMRPNGRLWMAVSGVAPRPSGFPSFRQSAMGALTLLDLDTEGQMEGEGTVIAAASGGPFSFGPEGRMAFGSLSGTFPATPGSLDDSRDGVVVIALAEPHGDEPSVELDRELVEADAVSPPGGGLLPLTTLTWARMSDGSSPRFFAAIIPARPITDPRFPLALDLIDKEGTLPAGIGVRGIEGATTEGWLTVLAAGARLASAVPVRRRFWASSVFAATPEPLVVPEGGVLSGYLNVSATIPMLEIPFRLASPVPWLRLGMAEGTTPARIPVTVDARQLAAGFHTANVQVSAAGGVPTLSPVTVCVGALLQSSAPVQFIVTPRGAPFSHSFRLFSQGGPTAFRLEQASPWIRVTPTSGQTPAEITVTVDTSARELGLSQAEMNFRYDTSKLLRILPSYWLVNPPRVQLADYFEGISIAPGSVFRYSGRSAECEQATAPAAGPWPGTLGGCTLRMNGRELPLGSVTQARSMFNSNGFVETWELVAQAPYDAAPGSAADFELEDRNGRKTGLTLPVTATAPSLTFDPTPAFPAEFGPGDPIRVRMLGLGRMDGLAPWGSAASERLVPAAKIEAWVGGRTARVISAELSRIDVGFVDTVIEAPRIAPGSHALTLRAGGVFVEAGVVVVRPLP